MTSNAASGNSPLLESNNSHSREIDFDESKIGPLERFIYITGYARHIEKYEFGGDGLLGVILRYLLFKPFMGIIRTKYFIYKYILKGLLKTINLTGLHNMVDEDYYIQSINIWIDESNKKNKWFIGNIFGLSLFSIVGLFGQIGVSFIEAALLFFAKGLDFRALYKLKYQLSKYSSTEFYFLEKYSDIFRGYEAFKTSNATYNIIMSGRFIEEESIYGITPSDKISGVARYSTHNPDHSKAKVLLANYYLNGINMEIGKKVIRIVKIDNMYKIALITESTSIGAKRNYHRKNMILLENCTNFNDDTLFKSQDGLYFEN